VTEICEENIFYQRHLSEFAINITDDEILCMVGDICTSQNSYTASDVRRRKGVARGSVFWASFSASTLSVG